MDRESASQKSGVALAFRISWGGGQWRAWQGSIELSPGQIVGFTPLGMEADVPGSIRVEGNRLLILPRVGRGFDGVDLRIVAPLDATLTVRLRADGWGESAEFPVRVAEIQNDVAYRPLDQQNNRLLLRRAPGDKLHVRIAGERLVFAPGERLELVVEPRQLSVNPGTRIAVTAELKEQGTDQVRWSGKQAVTIPESDQDPVEIYWTVPLPVEERVYDLDIEAVGLRLPTRLGLKQAIASRKVQLVVLGMKGPPPPTPEESTFEPVLEIDPTSGSIWDRLSRLPNLAGKERGPLRHGIIEKDSVDGVGPLIRLRTPPLEEPAWVAYPLPVKRTGLPHVLEVEYPTHEPLELGISVIDANASGAIVPVGLDSGVIARVDAGTSSWAVHRMVFWPRTKSPWILLTQLGGDSASFGRIRVFSGERLPWPYQSPEPGRRMTAAYLHRPLIGESFLAEESADPFSGRSLDDWRTFYQAGTRFADFLVHTGQGGAVVCVAADGSSLYPSRLFPSTPRYDSGVLFDSGQDPFRKDVLELLFRLFDRQGLKLIPTIDFNMPLPTLEAARERGVAGLESVDASGRPLLSSRPAIRGSGPYYNPLHPLVQAEMAAIVKELAQRYGNHPSFGGVGLILSSTGYAQLPPPAWGLDAATIARFEEAAGLNLPRTNTADRAREILTQRLDLWKEWRTAVMAGFHRDLSDQLNDMHPGSKLLLLPAEWPDNNLLDVVMKASLRAPVDWEELVRQTGIDVRGFQGPAAPLVVRSGSYGLVGSSARQAAVRAASESPELTQLAQAASSRTALFYHPPHEVRLSSFDEASPFRESFLRLAVQPTLAGLENRKRFAHRLAQIDAELMMDGGWTAAQGSWDDVGGFVSVFRQLPAVGFATADVGIQPVVVRTATVARRTCVYLVNDSPWQAATELQLSVPGDCRLTPLGSRPQMRLEPGGEGALWSAELEPYELAGFWLDAPDAAVVAGRVRLPSGAIESLRETIADLGRRAATLSDPPPLASFRQGGFELLEGTGEMTGWQTDPPSSSAFESDDREPHGGSRCVRVVGEGTRVSLWSDPLPMPALGRISVRGWLRSDGTTGHPVIRIAVVGGQEGPTYERSVAVEPQDGDSPPGATWRPFELTADDLPSSMTETIRLRLDVEGLGQTWIDDVEVVELSFSKEERIALQRLLLTAGFHLDEGKTGDCLSLLDGYWPSLLRSHVPLASAESDVRPTEPREARAPTSKKPGFLDRIKEWNPFR
jgi:hypothetical protein